MLFKHLSLIVSVAALTLVASAMSAFAETANSSDPATRASSVQDSTSAIAPGTIPTTAAALQGKATNSAVKNTTSQTPASKETQIAQTDIDLGRTTRGGSSYVGAAGNLGLGGETAVGSTNLAVISKIGLTRNIAVRPSAIFGDSTAILVPVTYDFPLQRGDENLEPARFSPYAGAGVSLNTGDDTGVGFIATGGVDVPLSAQYTATAGLNVSFKEKTDFGLLLGVGYNFSGF